MADPEIFRKVHGYLGAMGVREFKRGPKEVLCNYGENMADIDLVDSTEVYTMGKIMEMFYNFQEVGFCGSSSEEENLHYIPTNELEFGETLLEFANREIPELKREHSDERFEELNFDN